MRSRHRKLVKGNRIRNKGKMKKKKAAGSIHWLESMVEDLNKKVKAIEGELTMVWHQLKREEIPSNSHASVAGTM